MFRDFLQTSLLNFRSVTNVTWSHFNGGIRLQQLPPRAETLIVAEAEHLTTLKQVCVVVRCDVRGTLAWSRGSRAPAANYIGSSLKLCL
jgi:hypothetical protein